ncbi:DUF6037 family protein [Stenotrophomonas sp. AB1(2024)]|uniref:DUF6037 family protein n=1 Tax=Stenotrophomonas sp. AB1(2024) TaxID=3132215 RepID=UPI0030A545EC
MRMDGLARLHASMQAIGLTRAKFRVRHNHLTFAGLFLADVTPYELALACLGHDFVLIFDVTRDYEVSAYLGEQYGALAAALGTGAGSGNPLRSSDFLREIDDALPRTVGPGDRPTTADVVHVYRDMEEADKMHLCGWRDNTVRKERVSATNLAKTRRLLGQDAYDLCRRRNLSTCWTDDPGRAIAYTLPAL